jgi:hypothetical protein
MVGDSYTCSQAPSFYVLPLERDQVSHPYKTNEIIVKVKKGKLSLCLAKHHATKAY